MIFCMREPEVTDDLLDSYCLHVAVEFWRSCWTLTFPVHLSLCLLKIKIYVDTCVENHVENGMFSRTSPLFFMEEKYKNTCSIVFCRRPWQDFLSFADVSFNVLYL